MIDFFFFLDVWFSRLCVSPDERVRALSNNRLNIITIKVLLLLRNRCRNERERKRKREREERQDVLRLCRHASTTISLLFFFFFFFHYIDVHGRQVSAQRHKWIPYQMCMYVYFTPMCASPWTFTSMKGEERKNVWRQVRKKMKIERERENARKSNCYDVVSSII